MIRRSQRGFSLLELMIVVSIILIISAVTVPNLLRARQNAYEVSAVGFLHTMQTEQITYRTTHGSYATSFSQLPGLVGTPVSAESAGGLGGLQDNPGGSAPGVLGSTAPPAAPTSTIIRNSYIFTLTTVNNEQWYCTATPVLDRYYGQYLSTNETGFIQSRKGASALSSGFVQ